MSKKRVWRKSTRCEAGACVEVSFEDNGDVLVRDSKLGESGPVLRFSREEWNAFRLGALAGEFDV